MRFFEIFMVATAAISIINLIFLHNKRAGLILPIVCAGAVAVSIIFEGYRIFMAPAYLLSLILLVQGIVWSVRCKNSSCATPIKVAGTIMLVLLFAGSLVLSILFPVVDIPAPSGSYPVGTTLLAFTDTSRSGAPTSSGKAELAGATVADTKPAADELTGVESVATDSQGSEGARAESTEDRIIPVQIWYPASDISGKKCANWMSSVEMSRLFAECKKLPDLLGQLALVKTNSYRDAVLSEKEEKYPVVLFSGGGAMFNGQNVIQMEELASHGYIVCAVGHPYDDFACEYPDGSIIPYDIEHLKALGKDIQDSLEAAKKQYGEDGNNPEFIRYVLHNCTLNNADAIKWSKDMSFVADELTRLNYGGNLPDGKQDMIDTMKMFTGRLDLERLGIFGHSFGGAAAGEACLRDERFKAFINMDGTPFGTAVDNLIPQPFMILTTGKQENKVISKGYSADQKNFITVYINGATHMNFSDFNTILPNIGELTGLLGKIDSDRHRQIMNEYILAFFNKHLKGMQAPILDSDTAEYPVE